MKPLSLGLRHAAAVLLARWLPEWMRVPSVVLPVLAWLNPHAVAQVGDEPVQWAQRVSLLLQKQLLRLPSEQSASPGESQALEHYGAGVALGFYALPPHFDDPHLSMSPVPGSRWSAAQLRRVRLIGFSHGACVREYAGYLRSPPGGHSAPHHSATAQAIRNIEGNMQ